MENKLTKLPIKVEEPIVILTDVFDKSALVEINQAIFSLRNSMLKVTKRHAALKNFDNWVKLDEAVRALTQQFAHENII